MIDEYPILAVAAAFAAGPHGDARPRRAAGQGKRPARRHRRGARRLRRRGRGRGRHARRRRARPPAARRRARSRRGSTIASPWRSWCSAWRRSGRCAIDDGATIATSFPGFVALMNGLGAAIAEAAPVIIAVDGPAASGKGTLARRLARHYRLAHLDTGVLYRATALRRCSTGGDPADPGVGGRGGAARCGSATSTTRACARSASARRPRWWRRSRRCAPALLGFQRDFAHHPPAGCRGRRARRPRHRHRGLPRRRRQALRHGHARGPGDEAIQRVAGGRARGLYTSASCRT